MQVIRHIKTDFKNSVSTSSKTRKGKVFHWKWPLAIGLLLFAVVWRSAQWWSTTSIDNSVFDEESLSFSVAIPDFPSMNSSDEILDYEQDTTEPTEEISSTTKPNTLDPELISSVAKLSSQSFTIQPGDNLAHYFQKANVSAVELHKVLNTVKHAQQLKKIQPGQELNFEFDLENKLKNLCLKIDGFKSLLIQRDSNNTFTSEIINKPVERKTSYGSSKITDSLYMAGKKAKLTDKLIMELAKIFAYDIDFALDIRPGDAFRVLFEEQYVDGEKIGVGPILAAEFTSQGKKYHAFYYKDADGNSGYYGADGNSLKKAFIRTPVEYTRISSHFNLNRKHPILHKIRAHKGVDYAAPHGTPVKAAGNGKIIFVGKKGGYGNTIILQHGSQYSTLYGHLSRFAKDLKVGKPVKQGQLIGYVGSTGLASGPHLHYEFRINNVHKNPLTVTLPNANGVPDNRKREYIKQTQSYLALMNTYERVQFATSDVTKKG